MIYGKKVRLRAIERADLPRFVEWLNAPEVRRGLSLVFPLSLPLEEQWFEADLKKEPHERTLAIEAKSRRDWALIGACSLFRFERYNRNAEFGIVIGDRAYWGRGFGTDAVRTLVGHAFDTLNLHRVYLRVYASNRRAIRVYTKVGFRGEGRLREDHYIDGNYEDAIVMGMLETEWAAARGGTT